MGQEKQSEWGATEEPLDVSNPEVGAVDPEDEDDDEVDDFTAGFQAENADKIADEEGDA